jgi:hypothetical protein
MTRSALMMIIALSSVIQAAAISDTCIQGTWVTNGPVYAIAPGEILFT